MRNIQKTPTLALLILAVSGIALTACNPDPVQRPGNWAMTGASRNNIAVQAAYPSELINGNGLSTGNGVAASAAIDKALGGSAGTASGLQVTPPAITQSGS